jgi:ABC-2 type transport system ATP-binding protein
MIKIQNVCKLFKTKRGSKTALDHVNLELNQGEILALLGVNGAGKTTLSSIIASLIPPSSGQILFNGTPIKKNLLQYRQSLGINP